MILQCASTGESQGGIASGIGGDNNLHVVVATYQPQVQCKGTFGPEWKSCRDILADMRADKDRMTFGMRGQEGAQVELPASALSG